MEGTGSIIQHQDEDDDTPLHLAARSGEQSIVHSLLLEGAPMDALNSLGQTPLHVAVIFGHLPAVQTLLAFGSDTTLRYGEDNISVLDAAASRSGRLDILRALVKHGVNVNASKNCLGHTALHLAAEHNHADNVELLVEAGAWVDARRPDGFTPLCVAAATLEEDPSDVVATLLRHGADKDAGDMEGRTPLHISAHFGCISAIRILLASGADTTLRFGPQNFSALDLAACAGHTEVLRALLLHGVNAKSASPLSGCTALHHAAWRDHARAVDVLVEAGARVGAQVIYDGSTPLHFASESLAAEALHALLRHGASVLGQAPIRNEPPIHFAAQQAGRGGAAGVVETLLRWGADETAVDNEGSTAAEVVGADVEEGDRLTEDFERVCELLARAPQDRAWRRRCLPVLCVARARKMRSEFKSAAPLSTRKTVTRVSERDTRARTTGTAADGVPETGEGGEAGGFSIERESNNGTMGSVQDRTKNAENFDIVVVVLLEIEDEGLLRKIVGFL